MASTTLQLAFVTLLPVAVCVVLALLRKRTNIVNAPNLPWQIAVGIVFGLVAILCAVVKVPIFGTTVSLADAAPLAAGLFFGGPAGILAGVLGALGHWFNSALDANNVTRLADSLGCVLAGVYAALLRKHLFDDRMPSWPMALATAIVAEVMHLLLVFITNLEAPTKAFEIARAATLPSIVCVGLAITLAALALALLSGQPLVSSGTRGVAQIVQNRLLIGVILAFLLTVGFTALLQSNLSKSDTKSLLSLNIADVEQDIIDASDANLLSLTKHAAGTIRRSATATNEECARLADELDVAEIHVIDKNGMKFKIAADNVILCTGYRSAPLAEKAKNVHIIGDADKVGNLRTVIWGAWDVCMKL